ncbi:MAG: hypothetical protein ACPGR8_13470 [Limisphaerales bacterium]
MSSLSERVLRYNLGSTGSTLFAANGVHVKTAGRWTSASAGEFVPRGRYRARGHNGEVLLCVQAFGESLLRWRAIRDNGDWQYFPLAHTNVLGPLLLDHLTERYDAHTNCSHFARIEVIVAYRECWPLYVYDVIT